MQILVDFLRDYWQYISVVLVIALDVLILFVKKVKINYKVPSSLYPDLVELVKQAEDTYGPGHGSAKLNFVTEKMLQRLGIRYDDQILVSLIHDFVENILLTPTKKGVDYSEKA